MSALGIPTTRSLAVIGTGEKVLREEALALLEGVAARQTELIARWMQVGFVHGVMNTDNMALSGETIEYGPCAFIDSYEPATVFSSIDRDGRYAFGNQPAVAQWNLARFAEALLPMIAPDHEEALILAEKVISRFPQLYTRECMAGMRVKLGLTDDRTGDGELIESLL